MRSRFVVWLGAAGVIVGVAALMLGCPQADDPLAVHGTLEHGGLTRTYRLHVPNPMPAAPVPLVIALHGATENGDRMAGLTGFDARADRDGFFVVYPDGVRGAWNDGRTDITLAARTHIDDAGFIKALVQHLAGQYPIDTSKVFATGASNGGMMCHRLACEWAGGLAAVAPVIAAIPENMAPAWSPSRPVPLLMINGTKDPLVPWDGGNVARRFHGRALSVPQTVAFWVQHDNCSPAPVTTWLPDADPQDGTRVWQDAYAPAEGGAEVVLYGIEGGGHTWASGSERQVFLQFLLGRMSRDISDTDVICEFFKKYR